MAMTTSRAASSSGTSSSIASSREDLDDLATLLGLPSAESLVQERFRVDRRSLETLMFGNESNPDAAAQFFDSIMQATRTHITWPSRLKLGAKSKKDPHIKVIGRSDDVQIARNEILASLDTRASRVTMKIDVSYTDHSHIIGKAGLTIKSVMDETGCHIHFPDSNRTNLIEKSNQVSIAGDVAGVEKARAKVRRNKYLRKPIAGFQELTPLIFCFDLPILGVLKMSPDPSSPYIKSLQEAYNVQVSLRSRQKLNSTQVVVKGCEWEVEKVKEATQLLISHMCDSLASQVLVQMMIEISPQHHSIVLGRNNECLRGIMQRTSTQIVFLDPNDPNILPLKKSNVTITGSIHNVYLARQQLIGSLPVALMFEAPDRSTVVPSEQINHLMNNLDVVITTKYRQKQNNVSFIVRGIERNINNIYEARRRLVAQNEPPIEVNVPSNYMIPNAGPTFKNSWQLLNENLFRIYPNIPSPLMITPVLGRVGEPLWSPAPHSYHMLPFPPYHVPVRGFSPTTTQPLLMDHLGHFSYSSLSLPDLPVYPSISSNPSSVSSPSASPRAVSPVHHISSDSTLTKADEQQKEQKDQVLERPQLSPIAYRHFKRQAVQAMQNRPKSSGLRVPSSVWSGHGFSISGPPALTVNKEDRQTQDAWYGGMASSSGVPDSDVPLSMSNYLDSTPASNILSVANLNPPDLQSLLTDIGLEKYMQLFKSHEVDLATFRTLTEGDLKEIGVTAFGARRKMVVCIAELNKRDRSPLRGSAAPGAERKTSSTNSLNENW